MREKLIFDLSKEGMTGASVPVSDVPEIKLEDKIPSHLLRDGRIGLPEVAESEVVRHFVNLSTQNHHVDKGFYPLGSCTMKYNPKINEEIAATPNFLNLHPLLEDKHVQGALQLMYELGESLCEISGLDNISLQPAAGAHGELTGLLTLRAYHKNNGNIRKRVIIPDSAHGTNPASIMFAGYDPVELPSNEQGLIDLDALEEEMDDDVAAFMITNPNTLGLFEKEIRQVAEVVHRHGAQLYMDGANLNAMMGISRPGEVGFDLLHFNLHKTFSTPHGGGGPGAGPLGVKSHLAPFLPKPLVVKAGNSYKLDFDRPKSIGKMQGFWGAFGVMIKAYVYVKMLGAEGLRRSSESAILNSNYLLNLLKDKYELPYKNTPMHEFVLSGNFLREYGVKTLDVAKRLLDFGIHAPTVYFPLIVKETLMIEPTETECKETLEQVAEVMNQIVDEAKDDPDVLHNAPTNTPVKRLDEIKAAKDLILSYKDIKN